MIVFLGKRRLCTSQSAMTISDYSRFWRRWAWTPYLAYKKLIFSTLIASHSSSILKVGFSRFTGSTPRHNSRLVQASPHANAYVVSGHPETKRECCFHIHFIPNINSITRFGRYFTRHRQPTRCVHIAYCAFHLYKLRFIGPENLANLKKMAEQYQSTQA